MELCRLDWFEIYFLRFFFPATTLGGGEYRLLTQIHVDTRLAQLNSAHSSDSWTKGDIQIINYCLRPAYPQIQCLPVYLKRIDHIVLYTIGVSSDLMSLPIYL